MRLRCLALSCLLFLLASCALSTGAAPQPSSLRPDILYTTRGEFVQVRPMRPLTLNAHVQQFAYEPLGIEVAFTGSEVQGDQTVYFVKTMDVRTGHEMSRLTVMGPSDSDSAGFLLTGWSLSGKYLLLLRFVPDPQNPTMAAKEYLRWDLSASPPMTRPIDPSAHLPAEALPVDGSVYGIPSPHRRWIVFRQGYQSRDAEGKLGREGFAYVLYDPERDLYRLLALPADARTFEWTDDGHLTHPAKRGRPAV